jgi:zinc-ribbon domain
VRCARCGNENSDGNRFCGMCGASLLAAPAPVASAPADGTATRSTTLPSPPTAAPATTQNPTSARSSAPASDDAPVISGPSFLGLNEAAPAGRRRGGLSIDPNSAPSSSNLDYLLQDDEEETRRGGGGKYVLILLALALAGGLGYLRWKNQGFGGFGLETHKPAAAAQNSDAPDASPTAQPPSNTTPAPLSAAPATAAPTAATVPAQPTTGTASPVANSPVAATPASGATTVTPANSSPAAPAAVNPNDAANASGSGAPSSGAPASDASASDSAAEAAPAPTAPAAKQPAPATPDASPATSPKPSRAADAPTSKPSAALKPAKAFDAVSEAQKYIYGRGVGQDCDRGMRLLKPAADQANPRAMIEMGALYSAGLCTPHDLPTAYRWFALALRKDPNNQSVQTDLEKLWGEMTQPERQLAIKLSQ